MDQKLTFNEQQRISWLLMKNDLRYLYTLIENKDMIKTNYFANLTPYIGLIIDGIEDWLNAYEKSNKTKLGLPLFTDCERRFYEGIRQSIKYMIEGYDAFFKRLEEQYFASKVYFSKMNDPITSCLGTYDFFGVDLYNGMYCGNTILAGCYIPGFQYGKTDGKEISDLMIISGKYISFFGANESYRVKEKVEMLTDDFGGLNQSPVGNAFSDRFVLFTVLCQINFALYCVSDFIVDECTFKMRIMYLLFFYLCSFLPEINNRLNTSFFVDNSIRSDNFRNAMAHYKVGISLEKEEIINEDPLYGLTQKYLNMDYFQTKEVVEYQLRKVAFEIKSFLHI